VIAPTESGLEPKVYVIVDAVLVPHEFCAATETVPPAVSTVIVIDGVVEVPVHPLGKVHTYELAPTTAGTDSVCVEPGQIIVVAPVIAPGVGGPELGETAKLDALLVPHALLQVTLIVPDDTVAVSVIEFVVLVPIHPGVVQV
jgi:hypothetical protein